MYKRQVLGTHTVRLGISGRDFTGVEDLPLAGTEVFSWTGGDPVITNDVFSFDKNTVISGNLSFQGVDRGRSSFQVLGAGLTNGTVDPSVPVSLTVNQVKVQFDNATKSDNSMYTYTKSEGDLSTCLVLDTESKTWQVDMSGKRLTHTTWPEDVPIGLQIGAGAARVTVNPEITADLHLQRDEPVQADFTAVPKTGTLPLVVQFSDLSSGHPTAWGWTFGDGSSSDRQDPLHTYNSGGTYNVTLTVSSSEGSDTLKKPDYIDVSTPQPSDYNIVLGEGWNMVSVPKKLAPGYDTGSIFKNVTTEGRTIWEYSGVIHNWVPVYADTPVLPLYGFWIYSKSPTTVPLKFDPNPLQIPPTRNLVKGWELIGFTGTIPASARDTLISVRNTWTQAMGFDNIAYQYDIQIINGGSGQFSDSRLMYPTKGYWLFMTGPGDLSAIGV